MSVKEHPNNNSEEPTDLRHTLCAPGLRLAGPFKNRDEGVLAFPLPFTGEGVRDARQHPFPSSHEERENGFPRGFLGDGFLLTFQKWAA